MKTAVIILLAFAFVAVLGLICGYLSGCTRGSLDDTPPIRPSDLR